MRDTYFRIYRQRGWRITDDNKKMYSALPRSISRYYDNKRNKIWCQEKRYTVLTQWWISISLECQRSQQWGWCEGRSDKPFLCWTSPPNHPCRMISYLNILDHSLFCQLHKFNSKDWPYHKRLVPVNGGSFSRTSLLSHCCVFTICPTLNEPSRLKGEINLK